MTLSIVLKKINFIAISSVLLSGIFLFILETFLVDLQIINKNWSMFIKFSCFLGILLVLRLLNWKVINKFWVKKKIARESILELISKGIDFGFIAGIICLIIYLKSLGYSQYTNPLTLLLIVSGFLEKLWNSFEVFKKKYDSGI